MLLSWFQALTGSKPESQVADNCKQELQTLLGRYDEDGNTVVPTLKTFTVVLLEEVDLLAKTQSEVSYSKTAAFVTSDILKVTTTV